MPIKMEKNGKLLQQNWRACCQVKALLDTPNKLGTLVST